ncbi:MAG TPA: hypothetical protein VKE51_40535, partial [Vicinamibacterales bacterium]|nr:hypothetical protein [Vicinamibacterales bacterium]
MTFAIYADETGGDPLWQETQNVTVMSDGQYSALLGSASSDGLPLDVFKSTADRWLGVRVERVGEREQARALLVSVPYALRASDADTLGGRPLSSFVLVEPGTTGGGTRSGTTSNTYGASASTNLISGVPTALAKFTSATDLGSSAVWDTGGLVGINTATPFDIVHARFTNTSGSMTGYAVQNLGTGPGAYSGMLFFDQNSALRLFQGFNNSTHEYRINNIASNGAINFMLGGSSKLQVRKDGDVDISGNIRKGGVPFLHNVGTENTFLGENAGNLTLTGTFNTATGSNALHGNSTGWFNTASGAHALALSTTGNYNTATGSNALASNTTGSQDTALGSHALYNNISGQDNTAIGFTALFSNTTGSWNTATGLSALGSNTAGASNTAVGGFALGNSTTGNNNTASGYNALNGNDTGGGNTAVGADALAFNTTGLGNVAVGYLAGVNATTGSNNLYLGANVIGVAGETNTIYIGVQGTQSK